MIKGSNVPERCSLTNAVLFLHDQTALVDERVFAKLEPTWPFKGDQINDELKKLVTPLLSRLYNGDIKSWGGAHSEEPEKQFLPFFKDVKIEPSEWVRGTIVWSDSEIINLSNTTSPFVDRYYAITIDAHQFLSMFSEAKIEDRPIELKIQSKRGRKPVFDWESFFVEAAVRIDQDGLPDTQAEFEHIMAGWCLDKWGKEPCESTIRLKVSMIYTHPWKIRGR